MFDGIKKFLAIKAVRWATTLAAGAVVGWLADHTAILSMVNQACAALSDQTKLAAYLGSSATALVTLYFSLKDVVVTKDKVVTAAATGSVDAVNDPQVRAATASAIKAGDIPEPDGMAPGIAKLIQNHRNAGGKGG